ncbi:MAG: hypothetical protein JNM20_19645 [Rhizobiales bacterium]|nr:hypothetical protein [Hyphomicrobiales bacterium]
MSESQYRVRQHAFEQERLWQVGPDGLSWDGGDKKGHFPFSEIVSIRLSFTPTRFDFARYRCVVTRFNGWREAIVSTSYSGVGSFENRASAYAPFVRNLVALAAKGNPGIRFEAGESHFKYWGSVALLVGAFTLLALVIFSIGFNPTWLIIVKLAVIAFLFPVCLTWMRKNRPRAFQPDAISPHLLPTVDSEHRQ